MTDITMTRADGTRVTVSSDDAVEINRLRGHGYRALAAPVAHVEVAAEPSDGGLAAHGQPDGQSAEDASGQGEGQPEGAPSIETVAEGGAHDQHHRGRRHGDRGRDRSEEHQQ